MKINPKSKVFVGPGNVAGNAMHLANALKKIGVYAKSISYKKHPFGYKCDKDGILFVKPENRTLLQKIIINRYSLRIIESIQKFILFNFSLIKYNTFIFISPTSFFLNNRDLAILKFFNKKIIFFFPGCCERDPLDKINLTNGGFCSFCTDESKKRYCLCYRNNNKRKRIKKLEKYSDAIIADKDATGFLSKDTYIVLPYLIASESKKDINFDIKYNFNNKKCLIAHFPSNTILKRTSDVHKSIASINDKIDFFSKRLTNTALLEKLENVNILIDQFSIAPGLLGIEAMARGCVVIARLSKWYKADHPELPVISCEPEELTDVLIYLIDNPTKMKEIAQKGIEYYKKYHTPEAVGNYYKERLNLN